MIIFTQARGSTTAKPEEIEDDNNSNDEDIKELQTLVDLFLDEQEEGEKDESRFIVLLRVAPTPEFLVKGYDFKMLDRSV